MTLDVTSLCRLWLISAVRAAAVSSALSQAERMVVRVAA